MPPEKSVSKQRRYLVNAIWNGASGVVSILTGLILSPYVIRKLGAESYGIYALVFSVMSYYGLADLGLRSATMYYAAKYRAEGQVERISNMVSTLLIYYTAAAGLLSAVTLAASFAGPDLFHVQARQRETFRVVVLLTGLPIALSIPSSIFQGLLLGYQRFDLTNLTASIVQVARNLGFVGVLYLGLGLQAMGVVYCIVATAGSLLIYGFARRVVAGLQISWRRSSWQTFLQSATYGFQNFLGGIALQAIDQGPAMVVGLKYSITELGYFSLPVRLISYATETVFRLGNVALPQAAEFQSTGRRDTVREVAIYSNRYILALFTPLLTGLSVYGGEALRLWVNPEFAGKGAAILVTALWSYGLVHASQSATNGVLQGIGWQKQWLIVNLAEAFGVLAGLPWIVGRYGGFGAAAWTGAILLAGHGVALPLLLCRALEMSWWRYYAGVYARPLLLAAPLAAALLLLKRWGPAIPNLPWLVAVLALQAGLYYLAALYGCMTPRHRGEVLGLARQVLRLG